MSYSNYQIKTKEKRSPSHAAHGEIIDEIIKYNPGARASGFQETLARTLISETVKEFACDLVHGDGREFWIDSGYKKKDRIKRAIGCVSNYFGWLSGGKKIPDAFQFWPDSMTFRLWEVCNTNSIKNTINKWNRLAWELDCLEPWCIDLIMVDARGICSREDPWCREFNMASTGLGNWQVSKEIARPAVHETDRRDPESFMRGVKFIEEHALIKPDWLEENEDAAE